MRLLFLGDIVGRSGRDVVAAHLPAAEVIEVRPSTSRSDRGTVRFRCITLNQKDEPVQTVFCNQLLKRRP